MRLFFAIIIALSSAFTFRSGAEFYFYDTKHKFPDTNEGVLLEFDYKFKNVGDSPLLINDYKVACTCTQVNFPKEPIMSNQEGTIHVTFDTNGKYGFQSRKIEIYSNASKKPQILSFKVTVIPK